MTEPTSEFQGKHILNRETYVEWWSGHFPLILSAEDFARRRHLYGGRVFSAGGKKVKAFLFQSLLDTREEGARFWSQRRGVTRPCDVLVAIVNSVIHLTEPVNSLLLPKFEFPGYLQSWAEDTFVYVAPIQAGTQIYFKKKV